MQTLLACCVAVCVEKGEKKWIFLLMSSLARIPMSETLFGSRIHINLMDYYFFCREY